MKLNQLFKNAIEAGIAADPRGKKRIEKTLKKEKDREKDLKGVEKELFDPERKWNPYGDSRIIHGTGDEEVTHIMIGVDIETPEMLLADRLREKGEKIDALFIHHPEGRGLADLDNCVPVQIDVLASVGVPENQAEALLKPSSARIRRSIHTKNLFREERAAELLGLPAFTCHTPTDNLVWQFMNKQICSNSYEDLGEIMNALLKIEEFMIYAKKGNAPMIVNGTRDSRPGKVVASGFTGGTNGPEALVEKKAHAGVGTILSMHFTEKEVEQGKKHNLNMIQCSHMASDICGMNLMLDILEKKEKKLKTLGISGFIRVKR